jgi:ketosteroid isomerase-like protein
MTDASAVAMSSPDVQAIRAILIEYQDAWNAHDMTALDELFTDDAHWVNIVGMHWQGQEAIIEAHRVFHRTIFRKTELACGHIGISPNKSRRCRSRRHCNGRRVWDARRSRAPER